ncbi:hypothetical protein ACFRCW_40330 [Streptomyces sp. NPDC056653]|uniref:hypothetical protein n=1 Tax=Streptomyces sp. NPDC056653 TaxID=3345894 RepID=UPI0036D1A72A
MTGTRALANAKALDVLTGQREMAFAPAQRLHGREADEPAPPVPRWTGWARWLAAEFDAAYADPAVRAG